MQIIWRDLGEKCTESTSDGPARRPRRRDGLHDSKHRLRALPKLICSVVCVCASVISVGAKVIAEICSDFGGFEAAGATLRRCGGHGLVFPVEEEAGDPPSPGDHQPRHRRAGSEEDVVPPCGAQSCPFSSCADHQVVITQVVLQWDNQRRRIYSRNISFITRNNRTAEHESRRLPLLSLWNKTCHIHRLA